MIRAFCSDSIKMPFLCQSNCKGWVPLTEAQSAVKVLPSANGSKDGNGRICGASMESIYLSLGLSRENDDLRIDEAETTNDNITATHIVDCVSDIFILPFQLTPLFASYFRLLGYFPEC